MKAHTSQHADMSVTGDGTCISNADEFDNSKGGYAVVCLVPLMGCLYPSWF